jgi:hypothetical protein
VSSPLGPSVTRVVISRVSVGRVSVGNLLVDLIFVGIVSKVFKFMRMLDFMASIATMSLEDINDVLTSAN